MVRAPVSYVGIHMNKYLMLSAAAVLGTATGANAGSPVASFQFGTAGGGSYCDGGTAYTSGSGLMSWQHTNNNCSGGVSYGQGQQSKGTSVGKGADMSDNFFAKNYYAFFTYVNFQLPKKLKNGKTWTLTIGFSGTSSFIGNSGPLINVSAAAHGVKSHSKTSTVSNLKSLIKLHKDARAH